MHFILLYSHSLQYFILLFLHLITQCNIAMQRSATILHQQSLHRDIQTYKFTTLTYKAYGRACFISDVGYQECLKMSKLILVINITILQKYSPLYQSKSWLRGWHGCAQTIKNIKFKHDVAQTGIIPNILHTKAVSVW